MRVREHSFPMRVREHSFRRCSQRGSFRRCSQRGSLFTADPPRSADVASLYEGDVHFANPAFRVSRGLRLSRTCSSTSRTRAQP